MGRKLRQSKPPAAKAKGSSAPVAPGKAKGKGKSAHEQDDDSINDSGSEIGWDSEEDVVFGGKREGDDDYDDDYEEEGGILLSDLIGKAPTAKPAAKASSKQSLPKSASSSLVASKKRPASHVEEPDEFDNDLQNQEDDDEEDESDVDEEDAEDEDEDESMEDESEDDEDMDDEEGSQLYGDSEDDAADSGSDGELEDNDAENDWEQASGDDYIDEDDEDDNESQDEELDQSNRHQKLLESISSKLGSGSRPVAHGVAFASIPESKSFAQGKVTLNALMEELQDTRGISAVQAQLSSLDTARAAPKYVEKVVADRLERQAAYKEKAADMDKWHDTVLTNRTAGQLDLAQDKKYVPTYKSLVRKFQPTTDFEKEIQMVVVSQRADDKGLVERETQALQNTGLSEEEARIKHAELAKVNRLMLYEQMKRHRINKIKSKAYRALRRRERKRLAGKQSDETVEEGDLDVEDLQDLKEKNAYDRVKERMDLKHRNTSKWAKMALAFGHTNPALRAAYHDSVRLGHELRAKASEEITAEGSDAEGDYQEGDAVAVQAQAELQDYLSVLEQPSAQRVDGKFSKLFAMDFMQKAAERQKDVAREQAKALLREIERMEQGAESDENDAESGAECETDAAAAAAAAKARMTEKARAQKEVAAMLVPGTGMRIQKGSDANTTSKETSTAPANPWLSQGPSASGSSTSAANQSRTEAVPAPSTLASAPQPPAASAKTASTKAASSAKAAAPAPAPAPAAVVTPVVKESNAFGEGKDKGKGKSKGQSKGTGTALHSAEEQPAQPANRAAAPNSSNHTPPEAEAAPLQAKVLVAKSQEELVAAAFAGPDFTADFAASKQQQIDDELGIKKKQLQVLKDIKAGWGDWAGPGAMEVSSKILKKRERAILQIQKENEVQRIQRKDFHKQQVILSERRSKAAAKFKVVDIPYPFTSREEYERSLQMPIGEEWNAMHVVSKMTEPEVKTRAGRIIEPIQLQKGSKAEVQDAKPAAKKPVNKSNKKPRTS